MANSNSKINIPEAREAMNRFKMEAASDVRRKPEGRLQRRSDLPSGRFYRRTNG